MSKESKFWADQVAGEITASRKNLVVATGITPSGEIHVGNLREVLTADAVVRALKSLGKKVKFIYIADSFDPLRKVYPFLDAEKFEKHVGKPLSEIPSPSGKFKSYADNFLDPFLRSLKELDIQVEVVRADRLYKEGRCTPNIIKALKATEKIRKILKEETGKETNQDWTPFHAICEKDGSMQQTQVLGFDELKEEVQYRCKCGHEGVVPMAGGGKLTWRVDWASRWKILGVTVEPFGKDHASRGGSYDTGKRIVQEVFEYEPPFPVVYEWISLRGGGDMSSSKGNVLSIAEMVDVVPPEVLKYNIVKTRPNRRLVFDPGLPLLSLLDEFDDPQSPQRHSRAAELSVISGHPPLGVSFKHLVTLIQATEGNVQKVSEILRRTGYPNVDPSALQTRAQYAQKWLKRFGPEDLKFSIQKDLPLACKDLSSQQKKALGLLSSQMTAGMTADEVHNAIYQVKEEVKISPKELFQAIYLTLLGKERGPRAGFFLASLDYDFVQKRFEEVFKLNS